MANEEIIPKQLEKSVFGYANGSSGKKGGEGVKYRLLFSVLLLHFFCLSQLLLGDNIEMTNKNTNKMSVQSWNENAFVWDQLMDEGSFFQEQVVDPALEKMISDIKKGTKVLEIACGNGFLSRRLARRGADVWAFDSSANAIFLAKKRTPSDISGKIRFEVLDAAQISIYAQVGGNFDYIICNMAFMDIADLKPVFSEAIKLLKGGGVFVITQTHPCFEKAVGPLFQEVLEKDGTSIQTCGIKVSKYLTSSVTRVKAVPTLPNEHLFFHRSLSELFQLAFQAGFVIDNFEERAFPKNGSNTEHNGWHLLSEVPVIMAVRFRKV